ncbi:hypothetical protein PS1_022433 [Malus domestica]
MAPAMSRMASLIADRIAQHKGHVMPLVPKSVPRCLLGAKSGSHLERLATMNSDKVDSPTNVAPMPTPFVAETDPARKEETALVGSYEKFTKPASEEAAEICVLLKLDLLEDMEACAKFVDGGRNVVCPSSFSKHTTQYRKTALLAMMYI